MTDILKILDEAILILKPFFPLLFFVPFISFSLKFIISFVLCGDSFSLSDIFSGLIEWIFYREKFTCKMDSDRCAVFEDDSEIDMGEFECSKHCEHYGKCLNCMFFDYEEDKYICGKCYHRLERRKLKSHEDVEKCSDCMFGGACDYCPEHPYAELPKTVENSDLQNIPKGDIIRNSVENQRYNTKE